MIFLKKIQLLLVLLVAGFCTLFSSCSQKKNTFTSRTFHNLSAHYNGLYWANVSLEEGIVNIEKAHVDDYSKILPVFKYADDKAAKANYPQFDRAIEKTNKVIQYHSMLIKGKEYNRWIDENYMTLGKSHFYKRDYYAAVTVFEFVLKVFPNNPAKYDAFLWLVRAYNQMNSVIKTGPILDLLKHDKKLPRRLLDDYQAVLSDYYLRTEQYKKAEEALLKAVLVTRKKTVRGRYLYILAQLYEEEGNLKKATEYYSKSAKLHPSYEMEFSARLAKARTFHVDKGADTKELKKELNKMLRDEKNKEYLDQIYYALGDIAARENDIPSALGYFKSSAQNSMTNTRQKGVSFLRIADIYFDRKEYQPAQAYYDSTIAFLPKDFKNYDQIKNKKESLTEMIKNLNIILHEDSLQKIAMMDTAGINKMIDEMIAQQIKDEEKKKLEQETKVQTSANTSIQNENNQWENTPNAGLWYFYNKTTAGFGVSEFFKKWGNRPSEDNWRRRNKEVIMAEQVTDTAKSDTSVEGKIADNKTRNYYLKNLPFTADKKIKSNAKIVDAYYNLGGIYKEDLQDNIKAAETFIDLLDRYPNNKYVLNLYYQLYRIYLGLNNNERANYYKNKILTEHPDSEYAKIINNPDYQKALRASKDEIEKYYTETYSSYYDGKYGEVIAMANKADSFYSSSSLMPKFALLRAFSIGKTSGAASYEKALQGIIAKYPKDDAKAKAQELLDHLKKLQTPPADTIALKDTVTYKSPYTFKDSTEHQCIIIFSSNEVNIDDFKNRVSDFNAEYFRASALNVNNLLLDLEHPLVSINSFFSSSKAKDYYDLINQNRNIFSGVPHKDYHVFPISLENFAIFYSNKNIEEYKKFFQEHYLKSKGE